MTSTRVYRKGLAKTVAFAELEEFSGSQFDPWPCISFYRRHEKEESKKEKTFHLKIIGKDFEKQAA